MHEKLCGSKRSGMISLIPSPNLGARALGVYLENNLLLWVHV